MYRCPWSENDELYIRYQDEEWGVPVHDERKHFEFLVLEINQAGLSWKTVLRKRNHYRKVYDNFDPAKVANEPKEFLEITGSHNEGFVTSGKHYEEGLNAFILEHVDSET